MGHVVRDTKWGLIDINTDTGQILFQQRWKYFWVATHPRPEWTFEEKKEFHRRSEAIIRRAWSNKVQLQVHGLTPFAKKFRSKPLTIHFDICWVLAKAHWAVSVWKLEPNQTRTSYVDWDGRLIGLDSNDIKKFAYKTETKTKIYTTHQYTVAHEFGHAIGNVHQKTGIKPSDEYRMEHIHYFDYDSIMNVGMKLRPRHFEVIIKEMNKMIPDCTFSVADLKV